MATKQELLDRVKAVFVGVNVKPKSKDRIRKIYNDIKEAEVVTTSMEVLVEQIEAGRI